MRALNGFLNAVLWVTAVLGAAAVIGTGTMIALHARPVVVQSGSMSPNYPARSVAIVREVPSNAVKVGDVILDTKGNGVRVLHRVTSIDRSGGGAVARLKGDANAQPDPTPTSLAPTTYRAGARIPYMGAAGAVLRGPVAGFLLALLVLTPLLALPIGGSAAVGTATT